MIKCERVWTLFPAKDKWSLSFQSAKSTWCNAFLNSSWFPGAILSLRNQEKGRSKSLRKKNGIDNGIKVSVFFILIIFIFFFLACYHSWCLRFCTVLASFSFQFLTRSLNRYLLSSDWHRTNLRWTRGRLCYTSLPSGEGLPACFLFWFSL